MKAAIVLAVVVTFWSCDGSTEITCMQGINYSFRTGLTDEWKDYPDRYPIEEEKCDAGNVCFKGKGSMDLAKNGMAC